jgi:hypothetical protein
VPRGWRRFLPVLARVRIAKWLIDTGNQWGAWIAPEIENEDQ